MTKSIQIFILVALSAIKSCFAFSSGAGTCQPGEAIAMFHGGVRSGRVDAASFLKLTLNDKILEHNSAHNLDQMSNTITLESTKEGEEFKGFLVRLEKKDSSSIGATTLNSLSTLSQYRRNCDKNVVAMTHTTRVLKNKVEFEVEFEPETEYILDVTVVKEKLEWYYTRVEILPPLPTDVPSIVPSVSAKPSDAPSVVPSMSPSISISPSSSPSVAPSSTPSVSAAPSNMPSPSPSSGPTISSAPSASPSSSSNPTSKVTERGTNDSRSSRMGLNIGLIGISVMGFCSLFI